MTDRPRRRPRPRGCMVWLVASLADNKAALGPPLRRVGGERADARVRRRRRRDGAGRARPRALDVPGAQGARRRATPRSSPSGGPPARAARRGAAGLDRVHRGQPARRRRADDVRRRLRRQHRSTPDGPARAQDPPGGGLAPRARRGVGAAVVPVGGAQRDALVARLRETWEHAGALGRAGRRPGLRAPPSTPGLVAHDAGRSSASGCAPGSSSCSAPRAWRSRCDEPSDWSSWDPELRRWSRERFAELPLLRRRGRRARRSVGRADDHARSGAARRAGRYFEALREEFDDPREDQAARRSGSSERK